MTAPLSWTTSSPPTTPPLVVRPDRASIRRWLAAVLVLNGLVVAMSLVAGLWAASTTSGAIGGAPFAITIVGSVFQMVFHAHQSGRMVGADVLAEVGPEGVRAVGPRGGTTLLRWSEVASVRGGWNQLLVRPVPGAGRTLSIPTRSTDTPGATVRAAITHFSGGRL